MNAWEIALIFVLVTILGWIMIRNFGYTDAWWANLAALGTMLFCIIYPVVVITWEGADLTASYEGARIKGAIKACEIDQQCLNDLLKRYQK